jgi:hypothetical protein
VLGQEVEFVVVGMRRVHDRRSRPEASRLREQLDGPQSVLGETLVDLARLLVGVDVEDEALALAEGADLLEPIPWAGADGVGGEPDARAGGRERLQLTEVVGDGVLTEAVEAAAAVRRQEEDELDTGVSGGLDRRLRLFEADVVELADGRVARGPHLAIGRRVVLADTSRGQIPGQIQHGLPPRPEVAARHLPP